MTQRFPGLHGTAQVSSENCPDGLYLVRVERAQYCWHRHKPFYLVRFAILEPKQFVGQVISGRFDCTARALWKLGWFLRDFAYDGERLSRDEVEEKAMLGLRGLVKVSNTVGSGGRLTRFEGFAPESQWEKFARSTVAATAAESKETH